MTYKISKDLEVQARKYFSNILSKMNLDDKHIYNQSLEQLESSLEKLNDIIKDPDSLEKIYVLYDPERGPVIVNRHLNYHFEMTILPFLLEKKDLIISRINELRHLNALGKLRNTIITIADKNKKGKLITDLNSMESEYQDLLKQAQHTKKERNKLFKTIDEDLENAKTKAFRSLIHQSWFHRDIIAPMIGGTLLVGLTTTIVFAMFKNIVVTEPVKYILFSILGYLFGQGFKHIKT